MVRSVYVSGASLRPCDISRDHDSSGEYLQVEGWRMLDAQAG